MTGCCRLSLLMAACCLLNSCIENDVPYPYLVGQITGITVDGMSGNPQIQNNNRTVSIEVNDQVDIQALRITRLQVTWKLFRKKGFLLWIACRRQQIPG